MAVQKPWVIAPAGTTSGTVTNATVRHLSGGTKPWVNHLYKGCVIVVNRTAETGTCTLAVKLQGYDRESNTYFDVANSDFVSFADAATGIKYNMIYPGATGSDADGVVLQDTDFSIVNGFLPYEFAVSVTHGGTSVSNTYSIVLYPLN